MKRSKPHSGHSGNPSVSSSQTKSKIPPILFEGDPIESTKAGPVEKQGPPALRSVGTQAATSTELPEAYGTGRLSLIARDPRCLYAHWDVTKQQYDSISEGKALGLRVIKSQAAQIVLELQVQSTTRVWFLPIPEAGTLYIAELGFQNKDGQWVSLARSSPATTPIATVSDDKTTVFGTIPVPSGSKPEHEAGSGFKAQSPVSFEDYSKASSQPPPRISWIPALGIRPMWMAAETRAASLPSFSEPSQFDFWPEDFFSTSVWTSFHQRALEEALGAEYPGPVSSKQSCEAMGPGGLHYETLHFDW